jgi:large subunit ribosomal protein L1
MGKIRTRIIGLENIETEQKEEQKKRSLAKKQEKASKDGAEEKAEVEVEKKESEKKSKEEKASPSKAHVHGKKYITAKKNVEKNKKYSLDEAVKLLKKMKYTSFDESVELHINVTTTGAKGEVELPHSTGKTVKVVVVDDAVLADLEKGVINFDILVTHPSYMPKLAKYARVLGPKGLMPNPKAGTISPNPEEVVKKFSKGVLRWKTEPKFPLIHQLIAKISFSETDIAENAKVFLKSVGKANAQKAFIKTSMSPSLLLDLEKIIG